MAVSEKAAASCSRFLALLIQAATVAGVKFRSLSPASAIARFMIAR